MSKPFEDLTILLQTLVCQNCDFHCREDEHDLYEPIIADFHQRVDGGELCPEAECKKCGAVMHKVLSGVIVHDRQKKILYSDIHGVQAFMTVVGEDALDDLTVSRLS